MSAVVCKIAKITRNDMDNSEKIWYAYAGFLGRIGKREESPGESRELSPGSASSAPIGRGKRLHGSGSSVCARSDRPLFLNLYAVIFVQAHFLAKAPPDAVLFYRIGRRSLL